MIPQIIHQTWKTNNIPEQFKDSAASWKRHHPQWEYLGRVGHRSSFIHQQTPKIISLHLHSYYLLDFHQIRPQAR